MKKLYKVTFSSLWFVFLLFSLLPVSSFAQQRESAPSDIDRTQITDLDSSDFGSSVLISIGNSKNDFGSGFVVGKNTVVTARHVVDSEEGNNYQEVSIHYGLTNQDGKEMFVKFPVKNVKYAESGIDIAVIELGQSDDGKSIGDIAKIAKLANGEALVEKEKVSIVGFPGDTPYGTLWLTKGDVIEKDDWLVRIDAYTTGGNSGSPFYNEKGEVIGVINASDGKETYGTIFGETLAFINENIQ